MMEHKAFLFDYAAFDCELRAILEGALISGDCGRLVSFINANLGDLRDPYEGEPLRADWQTLIESKDAHQYGDFALTKYYDPTGDIGLGAAWERIQALAGNDETGSPILGRTIGPEHCPFDPGKMGAYFQTAEQVREHHTHLSGREKTKLSDPLNRVVQMLAKAVRIKCGLYVTF